MLDVKYNAKNSEEKWQEYWENEGVFKVDLNKNNIYSIDTPPPTVNGKIHIGHIFSYTQTEILSRFKRMQGYNVYYPFGFDDNGLPTERFVEKQYGIKAHQVSREEFNKMCTEETAKYEKMFEGLFKNMGFSVDWDYTYSTISPQTRKISQKSFIDLYNKDKVYLNEAPALWCTECNTAIAQAELETKSVKTTFNHICFTVKETGEKIVIATTRPELLPACVAVFVNPNDKSKKTLIGQTAIIPLFNTEVPIMGDEKVEVEKGSGVVMCCTFGDITDIYWWKKYKLPYKKVLSRDGIMMDNVPEYAGLRVNKVRTKILEDLQENGILIKQDEIEHNVATHERCGTAVELTIAKQWFIKTAESKEKFLELGNKINWYPEYMKTRYDEWVKNVEWDWCISRQRYYGVPFPVWYCKNCGEVILPTNEQLPVNPLNDKPNVTCKCECNEFIPETDVMDTWGTSSLSPLINAKWGENGPNEKALMPTMSLRPNAHDIIRTWDFYTIVKHYYHTGEIPWNDVMISGHVLANKGEKISKSKSNSKMEPVDLINQFSADAIRYWTANGKLGGDIVFDESEIKNGIKLITKLWNVSKFVTMHLQDYNPETQIELLDYDKWILYNLYQLKQKYIELLNKYEIGLGLYNLEQFFWNYCDNYIEIVKNRLYKPEIYGDEARISGQKACYISLLEMLKMFAPYIPHITEEIYQGFYKNFCDEKSIHLMQINCGENFVNDDYIVDKTIDKSIDVINSARKYKSENNKSLKEEIQEMIVYADSNIIGVIKKVEIDIKATCNCVKISYVENNEFKIEIK